VAGDHAVAEDLLVLHPEAGRAVDRERVHLHERAVVEQDVQPFPRRELAAVVLLGDRLVAAAGAGLGLAACEFGELVLRGLGHWWVPPACRTSDGGV
jgi:hypothetical protein